MDGLILQRWKYRCTCLGLEPVSRSRIWEGLYIQRKQPCVCGTYRINLLNILYQKRLYICRCRLKWWTILWVCVLAPPDTFAQRWSGTADLVPHAHAEIPHMHAWLYSELHIYAQLHKCPSRRLICTIYNCLVGNLCMHMHAKEIYCWDAIRGLII